MLKKNKTLTERNELLEEQVDHIREEVRLFRMGSPRYMTRYDVLMEWKLPEGRGFLTFAVISIALMKVPSIKILS